MSFNQNLLREKADTAIDFLVKSLSEIQLIDGPSSICDTYRQACREVLSRFNVVPKEFNDDDIRRITFEVLCFATFIMTRITPKYFTRKHWLLKLKIDYIAVNHFNSNLIKRLDTYFHYGGFSHLREIVIVSTTPKLEFDKGTHLDANKRIEEYGIDADREEGAELERFGKYLAKALDAPHYPSLEMIGGNYSNIIVGISESVLNTILK